MDSIVASIEKIADSITNQMRIFEDAIKQVADKAAASANERCMMNGERQLIYSYRTTSSHWEEFATEPRFTGEIYLTPSQDLRYINTTSQDVTINFDLEYLNTIFGEDDAPDDNIVTGDIEDILQSDGEL